MGDLVPIYSAADLMQAQLLRDHLAERDIPAWIINEALVGGVGELPAGWASSPRVVVATEDAAKAREIALAFDREFSGRRKEVALNADGPPATDIDEWPRCLMCGERRMAVCKFCHTAGVNFPQAYQGSSTGDESLSLQLICPTCDEPFAPRFYRECASCGYEFEDGIAVQKPSGNPDELRTNQRRVMLMMGMLLLLLVACAAYLSWLMRS